MSPPGYWKQHGERRNTLVVRQDRYEVDGETHAVLLKDRGVEAPLAGGLRWFGAQGRLGAHVEGDGFYAHVPVDVGGTTARKSGKPMEHGVVVHGVKG